MFTVVDEAENHQNDNYCQHNTDHD